MRNHYRWATVAACTTALCLALAARAQADEKFELKFESASPSLEGLLSFDSGGHWFDLRPVADARPTFSGEALAGSVMFSDSLVELKVVATKDLGRLYIDGGPGTALGEPFLPRKYLKYGREMLDFGPIVIPVPGGRTVSLRLTFGGAVRTHEPNVKLCNAGPGGAMVGKVILAGKEHKFAIADSSFSGRYDNYGLDTMAIDLCGDGLFEHTDRRDDNEIDSLSKMVVVDGRYYALSVETGGRSVVFKELTRPPVLGTIDLVEEERSFWLSGDCSFVPARGRFRLPAGVYTIKAMYVTRKDSDGVFWTLSGIPASATYLKPEKIVVDKGEVQTLVFGPPLSLNVTYSTPFWTNMGAELKMSIVGRAGESYSVYKGVMYQLLPSVSIADTSGKVSIREPTHDGTFTFYLPYEFIGRYRVEARPKYGPFELFQDTAWHQIGP